MKKKLFKLADALKRLANQLAMACPRGDKYLVIRPAVYLRLLQKRATF